MSVKSAPPIGVAQGATKRRNDLRLDFMAHDRHAGRYRGIGMRRLRDATVMLFFVYWQEGAERYFSRSLLLVLDRFFDHCVGLLPAERREDIRRHQAPSAPPPPESPPPGENTDRSGEAGGSGEAGEIGGSGMDVMTAVTMAAVIDVSGEGAASRSRSRFSRSFRCRQYSRIVWATDFMSSLSGEVCRQGASRPFASARRPYGGG